MASSLFISLRGLIPVLAVLSMTVISKDAVAYAEAIRVWQSGSVHAATSHNVSCTLNVTSESVEKFHESLTEASVFIYVRLNFDDLSEVYENLTDVIDPYVWVWALEGKGYRLLTYPYDFVYLSWGALSPGVVYIELQVSQPDNGCFQTATDLEREVILARFVSGVARQANDTIIEYTIYNGKHFKVCLEQKIYPEHQNAILYLFSTYETLYKCWTGTMLYENVEVMATVQLEEKHNWLIVIIGLIIVLAFFSPLAVSICIQSHPPMEMNRELYMAVNTDLPVGFRYWLFHWRSDNKLVVRVRVVLSMTVFFLVGSLYYIVPLAFYKHEYFIHTLGSYLPPLNIAYIVIIVSTLTLFICFLSLCSYTPEMVTDILDAVLKHEKNKLTFLDPFKLFSLLPLDHVSSIIKEGSSLQKLEGLLYHHFSFVFKPKVWMNWYTVIYERFTWYFRRKHPIVVICVIVVSYITLFPLMILLTLPIFWFWSVIIVGIIMSYKFLKQDKFGKNDYTSVSFRYLFLATETSLGILLPFSTFITLLNALFYLTVSILYIFSGILINYDSIGVAFVAAIGVAGVLAGFVNVYGTYSHLLSMVISKALELEHREARAGLPAKQVDDGSHCDDNETKGGSHKTNKLEPYEVPFFMGKYVIYIDGIPHIPLKLFETCMDAFKPITNEFVKIIVLLTSMIVVVVFAMDITKSIGNDIELPAVIGQFLVPVFAFTIIPFVRNITTSLDEQQCEEQAILQKIEKYLKMKALETNININAISYTGESNDLTDIVIDEQSNNTNIHKMGQENVYSKHVQLEDYREENTTI